jgi:hypothetical protein
MSQGPVPDLEHYIDLFERETLRKRLFIGAFRSEDDPDSKYCYLPIEGLLRAMKEARDIIEMFEPSGPHGHYEDGPLGDDQDPESTLNRKERRKRAAERRRNQ